MLRSDQVSRLHRLGIELRRIGYYRFQINEMVADLLGTRSMEELAPEDGDDLLQRLENQVATLRRQRGLD